MSQPALPPLLANLVFDQTNRRSQFLDGGELPFELGLFLLKQLDTAGQAAVGSQHLRVLFLKLGQLPFPLGQGSLQVSQFLLQAGEVLGLRVERFLSL
ncbi:MAG TPA: hypothetical protein DCP69_06130 [Candidatus Omnitrophica bacterium]|nr:hypothetical protein [Candidatus Omnitrophota bacterium]